MITRQPLYWFLCALLLTGFAWAEEKSTSSNKQGDVPEFITAGIKELAAEMENAQKDPGKATLRTEPNFFNKSEPVEPQVLIDLLGKKLDRDRHVDAYIKWQLLGLQSGMFDESSTKELLKLYRKAPRPDPMPGAGGGQQLEQAIRTLKKEEVDQANTMWTQKVDEHMKLNGPVLAYRSALYGLMTRDFDVLVAGFRDAEERAMLGYEIKPFVTQLTGDIRNMAALAKPADISRLQQLARFYAGKQGGLCYKSIAFDEKAKKAKLVTAAAGFEKKQLDELATALGEMAKAGF